VQARASALLLQYRRHRIPLFAGASDTSDEHEHVCIVCRSVIKIGEGRYRVGEIEYHAGCFKLWLTAPLARHDRRVE
jgi:hypothetical protein